MIPVPLKAGVDRLADALALVFFALASAWLTWPLLPRMTTALSGSADALLNFWSLSWSFHILPRDPLALFDANIFFPRPDTLAYSEHLFGVTLFAAPAYWITGSAVFAYNFAFLGSFVLSGWGMYLLVRELSGSRWAALFAGTVYLAAPYRFLHLLHIQVLSAQWFPFVFLFLFRYLRDGRPRQALAVGLFAALQALSCNYYALYLALALALFGVLLLAFRAGQRSLVSLSRLGVLGGTGLAVVLVALPFALPYERNRSEQGFYRRYQDVVQFSARPLDYFRPTASNKAPHMAWLPPMERSEKALFPGALVIALAAWGALAMPRRENGQRPLLLLFWAFFMALVLVGFILSLGPEISVGGERVGLPYRWLYRHVPGFGGMRAPARLSIWVILGLAALGGGGLAFLLDKARRFRFRPAIGAAVIGLALYEYQTHDLERVTPPAPEIPPVYHWLGNQDGDFGALEIPMYEDIENEALRLYYSTAHFKRLANGFSGWWPNDYWVLVGRMRNFPIGRALAFLEREVPVQYVLIHYAELAPERRRALERDIERYRDRLPLRARFGTDAVYEILPREKTETGPPP